MKKKLVSVVMPTYNRGYIIKMAIDSILNQTYKNLELIIVDDCSNDNTKEIISKYDDNRLKYIRLSEKKGANYARNIGIKNIQNYIMIGKVRCNMKKVNNKDVTVSVAMATYNGKDFIENQIKSILNNLKENDELIISDDGSTDGTLDIIKKYTKKDKRVKLLEGPKKGVIKNFENALYNCNGDYIFLSDQDDYWQPNKREVVLQYFQKENPIALVHDAQIVDENDKVIMESWFKHRKSKKGLIYNLIKNRYLGCCMAFKKELLTYSLPMPDDIEMHDWWLGLVAEKKGKTLFINEKLINYRRHSKNVSSLDHYPLKKMIKNRVVFIKRLEGR